jgi:hypothetical protein
MRLERHALWPALINLEPAFTHQTWSVLLDQVQHALIGCVGAGVH